MVGEDEPLYVALRSGSTVEIGGKHMMRKDTGTTYRIVVRRELSRAYAVAFEGMEIETKDGDTILTGEVMDQPHLYGILERINGLGLQLLSVQALSDDVHPNARGNREPEDSEL